MEKKNCSENEKLFTLSGHFFFFLDHNIRNRFLCSVVNKQDRIEGRKVTEFDAEILEIEQTLLFLAEIRF